MRIEKKCHFYAAHRNQDLKDKCNSLHGHSYFITVVLEAKKVGSITILFSDIDTQLDAVIKGKFDHSLLIDMNDPLYETLLIHHPDFKMVVFDKPTSVENLCFELFKHLRVVLPVIELFVQETTTSTIHYTFANYEEDLHKFKIN